MKHNLAALFLFSASLVAQSDNTSLSGVVKDQSGALVPSASVLLLDERTNLERRTSTNDSGFYIFTSRQVGDGYHFVGSHLRPRIRAPESWKLPVGLSLSTEFGPTSKSFDQSEFGIELRPIIDQTIGKFYWAFNPNIEWSMKGPEAGLGIRGMNFNPSFKLQWMANEKVAIGAEYYGNTGTLTRIAPSAQQQHMIYPSVDLFLSEDWEFNAGYGIQVAGSGDKNILKVIVGRRFGW